MKNAFIIAATASGCGKTTLSLGLMRALTRSGVRVQPFKCGPDYIDTQYHRQATGRDSVNLDLFMASENHVRALFDAHAADSEVGLVEGAMGLFDGYCKMQGSPADLACRLQIPVVLLVDASSAAYSAAAALYGFTRFRPEVKVAGVIFNRVASPRHYAFLLEACRDAGLRSFGYLSKNGKLHIPSRHLGLTLDAASDRDCFIGLAADEVEAHVDIEGLLAATCVAQRSGDPPAVCKESGRVAVARDEAFNFVYPANLAAFRREIVCFSPLRDRELPEADLVYLPGGYPELYADGLESNRSMRAAIKAYVENGGRLLAECGGMIYLSEEIDGKAMCGVFPLKTTMAGARLRLGYRIVRFPGLTLRGHEFHYSRTCAETALPSVARQFDAGGAAVDTPVYRHKNAIAGYTHLYWAETDIFKLWNP